MEMFCPCENIIDGIRGRWGVYSWSWHLLFSALDGDGRVVGGFSFRLGYMCGFSYCIDLFEVVWIVNCVECILGAEGDVLFVCFYDCG